jgi:hypothetical protein
MVARYVVKGGYLVRLMVNISLQAALVILWAIKDALYMKTDQKTRVRFSSVSG